MQRISFHRFLCSFSLMMLVLLLLMPATVACGSSVASTRLADVKSLDVANSENYSTKNLNIIVKTLTAKGNLANVEGSLDIVIWHISMLRGEEKFVLQRWDDVPLVRSSFQDGIGNVLSLEYYRSFTPERGENAVIHVTFTAEGTVLDTEKTIVLSNGAFCNE